MYKRLMPGISVLLVLLLAACNGTTDGTATTPATTQPTTDATTTPTQTQPTDDTTPTSTYQPPTPSDSYPLVCFQPPSGDWHNYFTFEIENYVLKYQAIRYDYYPIDSDAINGVNAGDFTAYVGDLWNSYNTCFLVYYSRLDGKLHYKVIDPYAIPGTDPDRGDMGTTHEGILEASATSLPANYVRFTYRGPYGVHVNWTDDTGRGHYAVIDQWAGVTEKGDANADDRPAVRDATARGRIVPRADYLELNRQKQEEEGGIVNWVREDGNHLELNFDLNGGSVSGSYWWRHSMNFHWPQADPDWPKGTITMTKIGDLTGTYSGGEAGSFEGTLTGTITGTYNGVLTDAGDGTLDGTWWGEMDTGGRITGTIQYTMSYADAEITYEDWLDFEAYLE
jgi:hypothetical protein